MWEQKGALKLLVELYFDTSSIELIPNASERAEPLILGHLVQ